MTPQRPTALSVTDAHAIDPRPHVLIVGGGFAGLAAARALADAPVRITLVDRTNHHLFQPLLYQVATAVLNPADISVPIRWLLRDQANATVIMAEVDAIDAAARRVSLDNGTVQVAFDYLVLAAGARHAYFGHPEWEAHAPGLKSLEDALEMSPATPSIASSAASTPPPPACSCWRGDRASSPPSPRPSLAARSATSRRWGLSCAPTAPSPAWMPTA